MDSVGPPEHSDVRARRPADASGGHRGERVSRLAIAALGLPLMLAVLWELVCRFWSPSVAWKVRVLPWAESIIIALLVIFGLYVITAVLGIRRPMVAMGLVIAGVIVLSIFYLSGLLFITGLAILIAATRARRCVVEAALAIGGIVVSASLALALSVAKTEAYRAQFALCGSNIRLLSIAVIEYAQDHNDMLPDAGKWSDEVLPYVRNPNVFVCPLAPALRSGYAFNTRLSRRRLRGIKDPAHTVLLFESDRGWNAANGQAILAPSSRHDERTAVALADGSAVWIDLHRALPKDLWEPGKFFRPER